MFNLLPQRTFPIAMPKLEELLLLFRRFFESTYVVDTHSENLKKKKRLILVRSLN